jgi:D-methionine transport system ATP-binding protein
MTAVRAICDRVAVLDAGRVVEEETVEQLLTRPVSAPAKRLLAGQIQGAANFA